MKEHVMNATAPSGTPKPLAGRPRLVKAAEDAENRMARQREAAERRARRELSLTAILDRAAGCRPRDPRALFDSLFEAAAR